jgi:preprotein translocase subunit SecG
MWNTVLTILHIVACIFLVVVVLLQTGKGTDVNAVFGGSSQTIFGSSGAGNFLTRLTTAIAAVFMATSLFLTYGAAKRTTKSVFDDAPPTPPVTTPATPEQAPTPPNSPSGTTSENPAEAPAASQTAPAPAPSASVTPAPAATETAKTPTEETKPAGDTAKTPAPSKTAPAAPK